MTTVLPVDLESLTVKDLKQFLKERALKTTGVKRELIARLEEWRQEANRGEQSHSTVDASRNESSTQLAESLLETSSSSYGDAKMPVAEPPPVAVHASSSIDDARRQSIATPTTPIAAAAPSIRHDAPDTENDGGHTQRLSEALISESPASGSGGVAHPLVSPIALPAADADVDRSRSSITPTTPMLTEQPTTVEVVATSLENSRVSITSISSSAPIIESPQRHQSTSSFALSLSPSSSPIAPTVINDIVNVGCDTSDLSSINADTNTNNISIVHTDDDNTTHLLLLSTPFAPSTTLDTTADLIAATPAKQAQLATPLAQTVTVHTSTPSEATPTSTTPVMTESVNSNVEKMQSTTPASTFTVGVRIELSVANKIVTGVVKHVGTVRFADGEWYGVAIDQRGIGKHDGIVDGHRYFQCGAMCGVFVRRSAIRKTITTTTTKSTVAPTAQPRPLLKSTSTSTNNNNTTIATTATTNAHIRIGSSVMLIARQNERAIVRFVGAVKFAPGEWIGVELARATGRNDGSVDGERYFSCAAAHGLMVRASQVVVVATTTTSSSSTTAAAKHRVIRNNTENARANTNNK